MLAKLKKKKQGVLIKFPKKKQDLRVDLPTIGLETLKDCKRSGIKGIVLKSLPGSQDTSDIKTNFLSLITSLFFNNEVKKSVLDPLTCIIRCAILSYKPIGTKISIIENKITID